MKHVLLVFVTLFFIVFGKRYPRGFNDSVEMIHRDYASRTVPKNSLNIVKDKNVNLKNHENSERFIVVDNRVKFNGTRNSLKNYQKKNQFRSRGTMSYDNLKKIKTRNERSTGNKITFDRVTLSHQNRSKGNRTQNNKTNSIKEMNKKSTNSKVQQEKFKDNMAKNKNVKEVVHRRHHNHRAAENHHNHSKRTIETDRILKLANKRLMNARAQDSQKKKSFFNQNPKYKRNDEKGSRSQKKYYKWLILPGRNVNLFNDFQNDSMTDEYRRKLTISSNLQPGVTIDKNKILSNGQSYRVESGKNKKENFVDNKNFNFNEQIMKKSWNPNNENIGKRNSGYFRYRIDGTSDGKNLKKLNPRGPNIRNIQNLNTEMQYEKNLETIVENALRVANPTVQSFTDHPSSSSSQYQNFEKKETLNYENIKFNKQDVNNFEEYEIPTTTDYEENFGKNIPSRNSVPEKYENLWKIDNDVNAKSILKNHTKFQIFSFVPGRSNQYPVLREIYRKDLNSKLLSSPKKERREILTDDPYYFYREQFENLTADEIFHRHRVLVENSILPTKLNAKDDTSNLFNGVRLFLDRRTKREDYYRLQPKESKKDPRIGSKKNFKNQLKIDNHISEAFESTNFEKLKSREKKFPNSDRSMTKNSITNGDFDELSLNLKDHVHDYFEEEYVTKAEEQEDYRDDTSHEEHAGSLKIKNIPKIVDTMIFKREIDRKESTTGNPSISNSTVSEKTERILKRINFKKKRLTPKFETKLPGKSVDDEKRVSKIRFKKKVSKKNIRPKKNDQSKSKMDDIKKNEPRTKANLSERDHRAPDFKHDGIKEDYFMMADGSNENHLNKNIVLPIDIKVNDRVDDFITSKNAPLTSMRPIITKKKEFGQDHSKRKLTLRDKIADDDFSLYDSIDSDIATDLNFKDYKLRESNNESKSSLLADDIHFESFPDRKTWNILDDSEILIQKNNDSVSMTPNNSMDLQEIFDNDSMTPYKMNNLVYKPYVMESGSRSLIDNTKRQQFKIISDPNNFINTTFIKWNDQDHLDPNDVNFEVHGRQPCYKNNEKGIDACSEEESQEGDQDDEKKNWPVSPGPIVCQPDYDVSTTFAAKPTEYPFVVSIQYQNLLTKELSHACNGVIVGTRFIVSAAHCLNNRDIFELVVQRTHDLCDDDARPVPVALVMEHENYNRHTRMNDLALLRLKYEVDTDQVSMPDNDITYNNFYSVGWGELMWNRFDKNVTKIQQKLPLTRYTDKMKEDPGTIYVTTAGLDITGAFRGDYGGILMNENQEFVGVQSKVYRDEDCEVFIRIRTYLPWIENMMKLSKRLLEHPYKFRAKKPRRYIDK